MDIDQPSFTFFDEGSCRKHESVKDLWRSLLVPNISVDGLFGNCNEDVVLQRMSLLLQTTIFHVKDICVQLRRAETELKDVKKEWQLSVQNCEGLREALKSATSNCKNCESLQSQLSRAKSVHEDIRSLISSVYSTLGPQNGSKPESDAQVKKAYNLMTQALQGTQDILPVDDIPEEELSPVSGTRKDSKHKRSLEAMSSPNEILGTPENQPTSKRQFTLKIRSPHELFNTPSKLVIPESFDDEENISPVKEERRVLGDVSPNVPTTPKRGITKAADGSPILGNTYKKTGKAGTPARDSPRDIFADSPQAAKSTRRSQDAPSPSLLQPKKLLESKVQGKGRISTGTPPAVKNVVVKLDPAVEEVMYEKHAGGVRRWKQKKLSLATTRQKQDLCTLKEFNGGVRAQTSDLGAKMMDEEEQMKIAMKASLEDAERRKKEEEEVLNLLKNDTLDPTFLGNFSDDDDEIIAATPQRSVKSSQTATQLRSGAELMDLSFQPVVTSTMLKADCSINTFAPKLHSTEKNPHNETCTPNQNLDDLIEEMGKGDETLFVPPRLLSSFDRIPEKKDDKPRYKYKGDAVRKKSERAKLCGHAEDPCCGKFYEVNGFDANKASRHRDVFVAQTSTPPGYWDPGFPESLRGNR